MTTVTADISCCLCSNGVKIPVDLPEGWVMRGDLMDESNTFCPDHAAVRPFLSEQCVGCVESWGECSLWRDFAYGRHDLTPTDFDALRSGRCPRRSNGTFVSVGGQMRQEDLSDPSPVAGPALADAIEGYWEQYPERPPWGP